MPRYFVYILASQRNGTIYTGSTSDIYQRIRQHKYKEIPGFSSKYRTDKLVYLEECESAIAMVNRERQLKAWRREWKLTLIEENNPEWCDLPVDIGS